ncbi:hypothetical protein [Sediminibacterium sp.]|uniref:hypothetical protein n=1 Tax=Sediminibacterium sp. TaxID=1917865 RepID=UPI0025FB0814|nr:hypothetical protein [Sediminibacterium sp.]
MTEKYLEEFIKKSGKIGLIPGFYTVKGDYLSGQISFSYNIEDAFDSIDFHNYLNAEFKELNKIVYLKQVDIDKIDFTLIIEKTPTVIVSVKDLFCPQDRIKDFFRRQLKNKPLLFVINFKQPPDTMDNTIAIMEAAAESGVHEGIQIQHWDGTPLETSFLG